MNEIFQEYRIVEQLAAKKYSTLYRAQSLTDPIGQVVIKIFISSRLRSEQERARFLLESSFLKQLQHTHILPIIDAGVTKEHPYVISPYLPAGSLRHYLPEARFSVSEALHLLEQVGEALAYAHKWEVMHGNLKPENILFDEGGRAVLTDFTLPNTVDVHQPGYRPDVRSALYMAPEQFGGIVDEVSEQYALGCLAYELLTGHVPFAGAAFSTISAKHLKEIPLPLSQYVPGISSALEQVVLKVLEKDPAHRYRSIALFLQSLTSVFDEPSASAFDVLVPTAPDMRVVVNKAGTASVADARITSILPVSLAQPASVQWPERGTIASSPTIPIASISASSALTTDQASAVSLFQTGGIDVPVDKMATPLTRTSVRRWFALTAVFCLFILSGMLIVRLLNASNTSALTEGVAASPVAFYTNTPLPMSGSTLGLPLNTPTLLPTPTPGQSQATMPAQPQGLGPMLPTVPANPVSTPTQPPAPTATPIAKPTPTPKPKPTPIPTHTPVPTPKPKPTPTPVVPKKTPGPTATSRSTPKVTPTLTPTSLMSESFTKNVPLSHGLFRYLGVL